MRASLAALPGFIIVGLSTASRQFAAAPRRTDFGHHHVMKISGDNARVPATSHDNGLLYPTSPIPALCRGKFMARFASHPGDNPPHPRYRGTFENIFAIFRG
jgi:hypothetical protein